MFRRCFLKCQKCLQNVRGAGFCKVEIAFLSACRKVFDILVLEVCILLLFLVLLD